MFLILILSNSTTNRWSFYTENGILWTATTVEEATAKIDTLIATTPSASIRLVEQIEFDVAVTVPEPPVVP